MPTTEAPATEATEKPKTKYYTLEQAAKALGMDPSELKAKTQTRVIQGFLDGGSWSFKVDVIDELAKKRKESSTLTSAASGGATHGADPIPLPEANGTPDASVAATERTPAATSASGAAVNAEAPRTVTLNQEFYTREETAKILGVEPNKVRVQSYQASDRSIRYYRDKIADLLVAQGHTVVHAPSTASTHSEPVTLTKKWYTPEETAKLFTAKLFNVSPEEFKDQAAFFGLRRHYIGSKSSDTSKCKIELMYDVNEIAHTLNENGETVILTPRSHAAGVDSPSATLAAHASVTPEEHKAALKTRVEEMWAEGKFGRTDRRGQKIKTALNNALDGLATELTPEQFANVTPEHFNVVLNSEAIPENPQTRVSARKLADKMKTTLLQVAGVSETPAVPSGGVISPTHMTSNPNIANASQGPEIPNGQVVSNPPAASGASQVGSGVAQGSGETSGGGKLPVDVSPSGSGKSQSRALVHVSKEPAVPVLRPIPVPDATPESPHIPSHAGRVMGAIGLGTGLAEMGHAYQEGDTTGMALGGANASLGAADLSLGIAAARGVTNAATNVAGRLVTGGNAALTVATTGYHAYQEQGTGEEDKYMFKAARAGAGALALGAGAAGTALVGGAALVTTGPALLIAGAVAGTGYAANTAVDEAKILRETYKIYAEEDKRFQASQDNRHIESAKYRILNKSEAENRELKKDFAARGATFNEQGQFDLNNDKTRDVVREELEKKKTELRKTINENSGWFGESPRYNLITTYFQPDKVDRYNNATSDLAIMEAATKELDNYEKNRDRMLSKRYLDLVEKGARANGKTPEEANKLALEELEKARKDSRGLQAAIDDLVKGAAQQAQSGPQQPTAVPPVVHNTPTAPAANNPPLVASAAPAAPATPTSDTLTEIPVEIGTTPIRINPQEPSATAAAPVEPARIATATAPGVPVTVSDTPITVNTNNSSNVTNDNSRAVNLTTILAALGGALTSGNAALSDANRRADEAEKEAAALREALSRANGSSSTLATPSATLPSTAETAKPQETPVYDIAKQGHHLRSDMPGNMPTYAGGRQVNTWIQANITNGDSVKIENVQLVQPSLLEIHTNASQVHVNLNDLTSGHGGTDRHLATATGRGYGSDNGSTIVVHMSNEEYNRATFINNQGATDIQIDGKRVSSRSKVEIQVDGQPNRKTMQEIQREKSVQQVPAGPGTPQPVYSGYPSLGHPVTPPPVYAHPPVQPEIPQKPTVPDAPVFAAPPPPFIPTKPTGRIVTASPQSPPLEVTDIPNGMPVTPTTGLPSPQAPGKVLPSQQSGNGR